MPAQSSHPRRTALGGNGLFSIVSGATIVTVALISAFLAAGTWILLPVIMLVLLGMAIGVVGAVGHLLGDDDGVPPQLVETAAVERVAVPEPSAERTPSHRPVLGH